MREKRKRGPTGGKGLAAGEKLDRKKLLQEGNAYDHWGWVRNEISDASRITTAHCLTVAGLAGGLSKANVCNTPYDATVAERLADECEDTIIVADTDAPACERKRCKNNPYCLTFLGQEQWVKEDVARKEYRKVHLQGEDPRTGLRDPMLPVGLKNLGATCYCNAFLQVWYQDLEFRSGVYKCELLDSSQDPLESPVFTLQMTFAALQEGNRRVFNPVKLVESLKLRTSEQQDAQEFSKLFMSHLDSEFKKQHDPRLRTLISDQFEGKLMYTTVCEKCDGRSQRESTFNELEISLVRGESVRDRLIAFLAPERLTGDNRYFCSRCNSLQNATRHTKICRLPPVLHISVLRFVYDLQSGERKKSSLPLKFPPYLAMENFVRISGGSGPDDSMDVDEDTTDKLDYELRGVLLHKGPSAYHGHYMAQVYDVTAKQWYSFNDEKVLPIKSLHEPTTDKRGVGSVDDDIVEVEKPTTKISKRGKIKSRRRIEDSDDDELELLLRQKDKTAETYLQSSDAYMLIYARRDDSHDDENRSTNVRNSETPSALTPPPQRALDIIHAENESITRSCEKYEEMSRKVDRKFLKTRAIVMDIYKNWSANYFRPQDPHTIVSREGVEAWLSHWFKVDGLPEIQADGASSSSLVSTSSGKRMQNGQCSLSSANKLDSARTCSGKSKSLGYIDNSDIVCRHGKLNPLEPNDIKVLNRKTYQKFKDRGIDLKPELTSADVCKHCVVEEFPEKLYQVDHPASVSDFNDVCDCESSTSGYWVSKLWLKDWLLVKPKMHTPYCDDPAPDSAEFKNHVVCEHGHLAVNVTLRRRVSYAGIHILKAKFPNWYPPAWNAQVCPTCEAQSHIRKDSKLESRRAAEIEKLQLRRLYEGNVFGRQALSGQPDGCCIVRSAFIRSWRTWVLKPGDSDRPESADNSSFLCKHGDLVLDLSNPLDFDDDLAVVTQFEFDILRQMYNAGPIVRISLVTDILDDDEIFESVKTDLKVCADCRSERMVNFETTTLTVVCLRSNENPPRSAIAYLLNEKDFSNNRVVAGNGLNGKSSSRQTTIHTYSGVRQSARIKDGNKRRLIRVDVSRSTTVLDIKLQIQASADVPTIAQRLFYHGAELAELTMTVSDIGIKLKDYVFLQELMERDDAIMLFSDDEGDAKKSKRKRNEGNAFGGTLLGGSGTTSGVRNASSTRVSPTKPTTISNKVVPRTCPNCTFNNGPDNFCCEMCLIPL